MAACATQPPSTATAIERGDARLVPGSVVIETDGLDIVSAFVSFAGERRRISILASDCRDGIGHIATVENTRGRANRQVFAYLGGGTPADRLFATVCGFWRQTQAPVLQTAPATVPRTAPLIAP
jgi:hypothetical protein